MSTHSKYEQRPKTMTAHLYDSNDDYVGKTTVPTDTAIIAYGRWYFTFIEVSGKDEGRSAKYGQTKTYEVKTLED